MSETNQNVDTSKKRVMKFFIIRWICIPIALVVYFVVGFLFTIEDCGAGRNTIHTASLYYIEHPSSEIVEKVEEYLEADLPDCEEIEKIESWSSGFGSTDKAVRVTTVDHNSQNYDAYCRSRAYDLIREQGVKAPIEYPLRDVIYLGIAVLLVLPLGTINLIVYYIKRKMQKPAVA